MQKLLLSEYKLLVSMLDAAAFAYGYEITVSGDTLMIAAKDATEESAVQAVVSEFEARAADRAAARTVEEQRRTAIDSAIAGDTTIASIKAMTNAEFDSWWSANVTTAAQAINVLKRVTRIVLRKL